MIRVVLADRHPVVRASLRTMLIPSPTSPSWAHHSHDHDRPIEPDVVALLLGRAPLYRRSGLSPVLWHGSRPRSGEPDPCFLATKILTLLSVTLILLTVKLILRAGIVALLILSVSSCDAESIATGDKTWSQMSPATSWNGLRVYLSSPRHASSGSRGECISPGWEENINGRAWNWYAANGDYWGDVYNPNHSGRNIRARGYQVTVSVNTRDDGWATNRSSSNAWGADVHIISHTNAVAGCPENIQQTVGMSKPGNGVSEAFTNRLATVVSEVSPGSRVVRAEEWGELNAAAYYRSYMELVFHTNQPSQTWMKGTGNADKGVQRYSWRYGAAIDNELGHP